MSDFTHFDADGKAIMVDVSEKNANLRTAVAIGSIMVSKQIYEKIAAGTVAKGDVMGVARVAGIMAAKKTSELIPLCHMLPLTSCKLDFDLQHSEDGHYFVNAACTVKTVAQTGVEMEALTGVNIALLTIYDMCKAIDKHMSIQHVHLAYKSGGKSGEFLWQS